MASEEMDRLIALLKRLHLRHLAQNLDEHLQKAAQLKLDSFGLLQGVVEAIAVRCTIWQLPLLVTPRVFLHQQLFSKLSRRSTAYYRSTSPSTPPR
jgi:hypothetical protein